MYFGWNCTIEDLEKTSERVFALERLINIIDGISRKDDILPQKISVLVYTGPRKGMVPVPHDKALDEYDKLRNWDKDGIPTKKALMEVDLEEYLEFLP